MKPMTLHTQRSKQTYEEITRAFDAKHLVGAQEEVQLREQDFGNFQVRRLLCHPAAGIGPFCAVCCMAALQLTAASAGSRASADSRASA